MGAEGVGEIMVTLTSSFRVHLLQTQNRYAKDSFSSTQKPDIQQNAKFKKITLRTSFMKIRIETPKGCL